MQKIVFVGIILIIGLFSLQYVVSGYYTAKFESESLPANNFATQTNDRPIKQVVYLTAQDSVIFIIPEEEFKKL